MRPQSSMRFLEQLFTYVRIRKSYVLTPIEARIMPALTSKKTRGARIRSQFSSIYAHDEKKDLRSDELDTLRRSRNPPVILTVNGEVHKRGSRSVRSLSWSLRDSASTRLNACCFYRLELCEDHGYSCEWVSGQKTKGDQRGEDDFYAKRTTSHLLLFQEFSTSSGCNSSSTSTSQHLSWTSPAQERSGELAPRVWCGSPQKPFKKLERGMTVEMRTTVFEIFMNGWRRSPIIQRTQHCMHPHTFLRTQIRNVLRKSYRNQNQSSTVVIFTSKQTEIAKSTCEPNWQGLLAADALTKFYFEQKSLVTW